MYTCVLDVHTSSCILIISILIKERNEAGSTGRCMQVLYIYMCIYLDRQVDFAAINDVNPWYSYPPPLPDHPSKLVDKYECKLYNCMPQIIAYFHILHIYDALLG